MGRIDPQIFTNFFYVPLPFACHIVAVFLTASLLYSNPIKIPLASLLNTLSTISKSCNAKARYNTAWITLLRSLLRKKLRD